jgi:hypothetical protein
MSCDTHPTLHLRIFQDRSSGLYWLINQYNRSVGPIEPECIRRSYFRAYEPILGGCDLADPTHPEFYEHPAAEIPLPMELYVECQVSWLPHSVTAHEWQEEETIQVGCCTWRRSHPEWEPRNVLPDWTTDLSHSIEAQYVWYGELTRPWEGHQKGAFLIGGLTDPGRTFYVVDHGDAS